MALAGALAALFAIACSTSEGSERDSVQARPHILLITVDALRADAVYAGRPGVAPNLLRALDDGAWRAVGIAPSSETAPAVASLLTGLRPWQHQVLTGADPRLRAPVTTLAERLKDQGYRTVAFPGGYWSEAHRGFRQGFHDYWRTGRLTEMAEHLLNGSAEEPGATWFRWVHLNEPSPPFERPEDLSYLGPEAKTLRLPPLLTRGHLERFRSPQRPLPELQRRRFRALYDGAVHTVDKRIGRLLEALEESGEAERTLVVITSAHGEELGEHGQILHGNNLGRASLEVPLLILWPQDSAVSGAGPPPEPDGPVATRRRWATLVEAAGGFGTPGAAPSLHQPAAEGGILSELYDVEGVNRFSLLQGDLQLRRRVRLETGFEEALPFDGAAEGETPARPLLALERWLEDGSTLTLDDPDKARSLALDARRTWHRFIDIQRTPAQEKAVWGRQ